jgi:hypothetical protein
MAPVNYYVLLIHTFSHVSLGMVCVHLACLSTICTAHACVNLCVTVYALCSCSSIYHQELCTHFFSCVLVYAFCARLPIVWLLYVLFAWELSHAVHACICSCTNKCSCSKMQDWKRRVHLSWAGSSRVASPGTHN